MNISQKRILVVEDDLDLASLICEMLKEEGYYVVTACKGEEALKLVHMDDFSLILLDLNLPDMDGMIVCQDVRHFSDVPIIIITGRITTKDKLAGLYGGADDYITKPFSYSELIARITAVLRRSSRMAENAESRITQVQGLQIHSNWQIVTIGDIKVDLTATEYKILVNLVNNTGEIVAAGTLAKEIWGEDTSQTVNALRVNVNRLRIKLNIRPEINYIVTVPGEGYSYKPQVIPHDIPPLHHAYKL